MACYDNKELTILNLKCIAMRSLLMMYVQNKVRQYTGISQVLVVE